MHRDLLSNGLVFKGQVRSGFSAKNGLTVTVTGPSNLLKLEKPRGCRDRNAGPGAGEGGGSAAGEFFFWNPLSRSLKTLIWVLDYITSWFTWSTNYIFRTVTHRRRDWDWELILFLFISHLLLIIEGNQYFQLAKSSPSSTSPSRHGQACITT